MQWTGLGSPMTLHVQPGPIPAPQALRPAEARRELPCLAMVEAGFRLARRGMVALRLGIGEAEMRGFLDAVGRFAEARPLPDG